jgi:hypothetical protein
MGEKTPKKCEEGRSSSIGMSCCKLYKAYREVDAYESLV